MLLTEQHPISNSYPVEASGWDKDQSFFVEKSELEWKEENGKYITLTRLLRPGAMIFVRLLQPTSEDRSLPVAYHTKQVGITRGGHQQYQLDQIQPHCDSKNQAK